MPPLPLLVNEGLPSECRLVARGDKVFIYAYTRPMKPVTSLYRCKHCGKIVEREGSKQWRKSFCEHTGKNVRITRINLQPSNQPASFT
jgi:tRNA(Ile2) C34 agmatinyltransferase TiaS